MGEMAWETLEPWLAVRGEGLALGESEGRVPLYLRLGAFWVLGGGRILAALLRRNIGTHSSLRGKGVGRGEQSEISLAVGAFCVCVKTIHGNDLSELTPKCQRKREEEMWRERMRERMT